MTKPHYSVFFRNYDGYVVWFIRDRHAVHSRYCLAVRMKDTV